MEKTTKNPEAIRKEWLKKGLLSEKEKAELRELRRAGYGSNYGEKERERVIELQFREENCGGLTPEEEQRYQELLRFSGEATGRRANEWTKEDAQNQAEFYRLAKKRKAK